MHFRFIFFLLLALPLAHVHAQITQTVRGRATDAFTGAPIPFATVALVGTQNTYSAFADSAGNFRIAAVPVGRYDLKVQLVGYEPFAAKEIVVGSGKEVVVSPALQQKAYEIGETVVESKVNKQQPLNTLATVSARMLSVEEAKRYAGGFDDPARLASSFAGVASNVGNNGIVVRGNAPKFLQWKIEGVEIPNPNHFADLATFGGGGLTAFSSQMLANSDFFTGAFPAEYSNALSGVFDMNLRSGNNTRREHTLQAGIIGLDAASEGPIGKPGKASYLFNYRYSTLGLITPLLPEDAGGTTYQDLAFKFNFPTEKAGTFSFWGMGLLDGSGAKAEKDSANWHYLQDMEDQDVKQYMGATGLSHAMRFSDKLNYKTTLSATVQGLNLTTDRMDPDYRLQPRDRIDNKLYNVIWSSYLNTRISPRHRNKTGFILTGLFYDINLKHATPPAALQTISDEANSSALLAAYTNSNLSLTENLTANIGLTAQHFALNGKTSLEPRAGLKWQATDKQSLGLGYGLHSRLERLNYYFTRNPATGEQWNRNLDFTKAHHLVLSYGLSLGEHMALKVEPYYQHLFSVPAIADSSLSFINMENDWFFNQKLTNSGTGRNIGLDISLEKYLSRGFYYMATASLFDSRYKNPGQPWRHTRFNRNYVFNLLGGKEWTMGKEGQNVLGINARLSYQGGDRVIPVDQTRSMMEQDVVYDGTRAFQVQLPASFVTHFTITYRMNRRGYAQEFGLKIINATGYKEFGGYRYNYKTDRVEEAREAIIVPNLSYKIDF